MSERAVSRRTALKTIGAGTGAVAFLPWLSEEGVLAFSELQRAKAAPALKALSAAQYATTEALVEAIIPTDERSPGAKQARVADYIDLLLSEADEVVRKPWLDGLGVLEAESRQRYGAGFVGLKPAQVEELLTEASRNERAASARQGPDQRRTEPQPQERPTDVSRDQKPADPTTTEQAVQSQRTPLQGFFVVAKQATIHGYYTSEIGLNQELKYKGYKVLLEFVGCETEDGKDCPHCGQKATDSPSQGAARG